MSLRRLAASVLAFSVLTAQGFASPAGTWQHHHGKHQATGYSQSIPEQYDVSHYLTRPYPDYVGWAYVHHSPGRWIYFGHSYTLVPGRGIVDEACNLPTSACPNSQRNVN